ncbi:MAG: ABC transporter substrate-binding protein [Chloroflexota bacterium]|nr:ABC transporter substrate-binding protein [Chloroflexota bacterium]
MTTFDPQQVTDTPTVGMLHLVYDNLVYYDHENNIVPELAESWEISEDGSIWTFTLRPDIVFSDGSALTADDVAFTFLRVKDPELASPHAALFGVIEDVVAVDDLNVQFITDGPFADLLVNLASSGSGILSRAATESFDSTTYGQQPVGTGPFVLSDWITGDRAEFSPSPSYAGPAPRVGKIIYRPIPEAATRAAMLQTGEADIAVKISPEDVPSLEGNDNLTVLALESMYQISIELNCAMENPPLNLQAVRHALNHAIDKQAIVDSILGGLGDIARSPFGPGIQFRAEFEPYAYDPDRARQLLDEAGFSGGFQLNQWSPDGRYLKDRQVSEAVQGYLQSIGLQTELQVWEWAPYQTAIRGDETRQAFMVGRATPGADYTATRLFSSASIGQYNITNFSDPRIDELLVEGRRSFDDEERAGIYQEIQSIWWEQAPWLFLHSQRAVVGHQNSVSGFFMYPQEVVDLRGVTKA